MRLALAERTEHIDHDVECKYRLHFVGILRLRRRLLLTLRDKCHASGYVN
jgi:hypothetical protein